MLFAAAEIQRGTVVAVVLRLGVRELCFRLVDGSCSRSGSFRRSAAVPVCPRALRRPPFSLFCLCKSYSKPCICPAALDTQLAAMSRSVTVAVQGCCHGELDTIYDTILQRQRQLGVSVDLLVICGDFESVRSPADLDSMAVPQKYRHMNSFHEYAAGTKVAPVLTVFIGGNHEASNVLQVGAMGMGRGIGLRLRLGAALPSPLSLPQQSPLSSHSPPPPCSSPPTHHRPTPNLSPPPSPPQPLYYGGYVAPRIFFLGYSGCVRFGPLRVAGELAGQTGSDRFR